MSTGLTLLACGLATAVPDTGSSLADARANAKSAMLLALDELQKNAGSDQRVTARADILDANIAHPNLTGVWNSWQIRASVPPVAADYARTAKDAKFRGWLVSDPDPEAPRQVAFANQPLADPVTLWGPGTLGVTAPVSSFVAANKVSIASPAGAYAWAVLDEGLKVRINTPYVDSATSVGSKTMQLGSGERPGVEFLPGLSMFERGLFRSDCPVYADFVRGIGNANFALTAEQVAPGAGEVLKTLTHDVTLCSMGLFTDVASGGLKQDFHLLTNSTNLPVGYQTQGVYASRLGMPTATVPSDPRWLSFHQFGRIYRDKIMSSGGVPVIKPQTPTGWVAATTSPDLLSTTVNRVPPSGAVLLPTIAKVQMLFSLLGRDLYSYSPPVGNPIPVEAPSIHNPQGSNWRGTPYQYDMQLLYMPIVTLHNPYNVAIDCTDLRVEFVNVPFAMQIFRNGVAQSTGLVPFETMFADNDAGQRGKIFGMNLTNKSSSGLPEATVIRLLPGEVKVFSPYIDPNLSWLGELQSGRTFWDIYVGTGITNNIAAIPGWRGYGIGYTCDWVLGNQTIDQDYSQGRWGGCMGIARDDQIHVLFSPLGIPLSNNKFVVQMSIPDPQGSGSRIAVSAIEMDYESPTGLQSYLLGAGGTLRYPKTGTITGIELVDHATTPIKDIIHAKPFALLSVQAKSTSGGRDSTNADGRLATKPWCFAHANIGASSQKVITEHPASFSHEFDLQVLDVAQGASSLVAVDSKDRGNFISGQSAQYGTKFGAQYDVPLAPLQTLAGLNGANPGGASGYLPRFAQPIGNSWAHPLISPTKLLENKSPGNYLDHSFLLNLALYDSYYFSGFAAQTGPFAGNKSTTTLAADFASDKPLDDPRLLLYRPGGRSSSALAAEVIRADAYSRIAAWQMMKGAFNINSTSVLAWKALLASIHDSQAIYNQLLKTSTPAASKLTTLTATASAEARISRFRLPASLSSADGGEPKDSYWLGPREYSDAQLQTLAENIVKQVRLRGPFLSLAEFVNRRLGSDETAQRGALQQAIDDSGLNQSLATAASAGYEIPAAKVAGYKYANPAAGTGPSYQGAPGFLTQADLLNVLGNAATPRSDTFTIRGYGEAHDDAGQVTATAVCEAVVQRLPDWFDQADAAETQPAQLSSASNRSLGRKFRVIAFRWLRPDEI